MKFFYDHKYDDIINIKYNGSNRKDKMTNYERAAQFSPFAALTGYESAIKEKSRQVEEKIELSYSQKSVLDYKFSILLSHFEDKAHVEITYFKKDKIKNGGEYLKESGHITKIDMLKKILYLDENLAIDISDIYDIDSELFKNYYI